jgi:hypothetical protein
VTSAPGTPYTPYSPLGVPAPATADELGAALGERLYVEGEVVVEDDRVLALTDDDEVELAYFFLSPQAAEQAPERLTYLRYEDFPLPRGVNAEASAFAARSRWARWHLRATARAPRTRCCAPSTTATASAGSQRYRGSP